MPCWHKLSNFVALRKGLRSSTTDAEQKLWYYLRRRQFFGHKFRRQYGINRYILDFYCPALHLAIEVDGRQHFEPAARERDRERTEDLAACGIRVIRFTNSEVLYDIEAVLEKLYWELHPIRPSSS